MIEEVENVSGWTTQCGSIADFSVDFFFISKILWNDFFVTRYKNIFTSDGTLPRGTPWIKKYENSSFKVRVKSVSISDILYRIMVLNLLLIKRLNEGIRACYRHHHPIENWIVGDFQKEFLYIMKNLSTIFNSSLPLLFIS